MTIPDYQSTMLPLLKFAKDQKEHSIREAVYPKQQYIV
jgi:restriction endonuclease Mrr